MLPQLIIKYLGSNRRLNIPGLGAFMVNTNRELIFSQLLKDDDGVLRGLLMESGLSDIETAATIDRFIFELRHATESAGTEFEMEGFGTMSRDEGGKLIFTPYASGLQQTTPTEIKPEAPQKVTMEEVFQKIEQANKPRKVSRPKRKKGTDKVLMLGILAAIVALAAIAYGLYASNIEFILELLAKYKVL